MRYYTIIVAGGSGSRMNADLPKQFLLLDKKPILMHSMDAFYYSNLQPEIILVLPAQFTGYWKELCHEYQYTTPHQLAEGGETRFDSVKNGLKKITEKSVIAVHDAVRPLISSNIITNSFETASQKGSAVTAIPSKDSVRETAASGSRALKRDSVYLIQTPQTFRSEILAEAYKQSFCDDFTDDASVVEKAGFSINLTEGSSRNIKITFPEDLLIAECLLNMHK